MAFVKACIFDLDGVIVDTAKWHYNAWNNIANRLGFEFSPLQNEELKGVSRAHSLEIILKIGGINLAQNEKDELLKRKNEVYLEFIQNMSQKEILPGVTEFLTELQRAQIKIGLGSASRNAKMVMDKIGLHSLFDSIIDGNDVRNSKPDPEVFLLGAKELNVEPSACVVFEDSQQGLEAANSGGFITVGIGNKSILTKANTVIPGFTDFTFAKLNEWLTLEEIVNT